MFLVNYYFYFISAFILMVNAAHLPETFKTCKKSDPNYKTCIIAAVEDAIIQIKDGFPALNVPKFEPLFVEKLHINGNGGKVDIEQDYTNLNIHGFSKAILKDVELLLDGDQCLLKFNALSPTIQLIGDYKMVGKVLILQINGFGKTNITLTNVSSNYLTTCQKVDDKNGKKILILQDFKMDMKTEQIHFDFENLVNGNPELSVEVAKVMNENSLDIFDEIREDYTRTFEEILKRLASIILSKVPYEEYYLA